MLPHHFYPNDPGWQSECLLYPHSVVQLTQLRKNVSFIQFNSVILLTGSLLENA